MAAPSTALGALSRYAAAEAPRPGAATAHSRAKETAEEFEAVFLNVMFNQMFSGLTGDGPLGGAGGAGVWRSFLADEYAKSFARSGGIGIGTEVYRALIDVQEASRP